MTTKPPIRQWRIRNLKAVEQGGPGPRATHRARRGNSSGKSTVLQSILLAVQAAQAQAQGDVFPLNGLLAQLGEFKDAHSAFAQDDVVVDRRRVRPARAGTQVRPRSWTGEIEFKRE